MNPSNSRPPPSREAALAWNDLVGMNLKTNRERLGLSQEAVARKAREWGLDWIRVTVAAIEQGKRSFELREMVALLPALGLAPADFFAGAGRVIYGPKGEVKVAAVAAMLSGRAGDVNPQFDYETPAALAATLDAHKHMIEATSDNTPWWRFDVSFEEMQKAELAARGEPETKAAKALDVEPVELAFLAFRCWEGRSLTEERDRRLGKQAGPGTTSRGLQAMRGHITRALVGELREEIAAIEEAWNAEKGVSLVPTRGGSLLVQTDEKGQPTGLVVGSAEALRSLDEDFGGAESDTKETD